MIDTEPYCLLCNSKDLVEHTYPPNYFNNRLFHYFRCRDCDTISISPLPSEAELAIMYGESDHSYLNELKEEEKLSYNFDYPNHHHQGIQLAHFDKELDQTAGKKLLDFACGSGYYLEYYSRKGFDVVGIEFDKEFADTLRKRTGHQILELNDFESKYEGQKFDIIHFGHVLEHLRQPADALRWAKQFAHNDTLIVIDGPLEFNACLSRFTFELSAEWRKRKQLEHHPQHLFFTNRKAQLQFFENADLKPLVYTITEQSFPLPDHPNWTSASHTIKYILSRSSILFSSMIKNHGNVFHFVENFSGDIQLQYNHT